MPWEATPGLAQVLPGGKNGVFAAMLHAVGPKDHPSREAGHLLRVVSRRHIGNRHRHEVAAVHLRGMWERATRPTIYREAPRDGPPQRIDVAAGYGGPENRSRRVLLRVPAEGDLETRRQMTGVQ